jgi:hypothetical protein
MEQIVFRNVGNYKSDAGESPKRRHTDSVCLRKFITHCATLSAENYYEATVTFVLAAGRYSERHYASSVTPVVMQRATKA